MWKNDWGWGEVTVKGDEIEDAIEEMMKNESLRIKAKEIKEEGRWCWLEFGNCYSQTH
ncbi:UDP-glycosyltransferase 13-like [Senna tora]|uniref:UDP-glycosyltransferase 13-like n=1 Tax=Senna tora TaxID=362788 RepID=A0A834WR26_9FABA|nr:UDP-glycosyltransferase 13-like [Senna tora]